MQLQLALAAFRQLILKLWTFLHENKCFRSHVGLHLGRSRGSFRSHFGAFLRVKKASWSQNPAGNDFGSRSGSIFGGFRTPWLGQESSSRRGEKQIFHFELESKETLKIIDLGAPRGAEIHPEIHCTFLHTFAGCILIN